MSAMHLRSGRAARVAPHPIGDPRLAAHFSPEVISAWQASFFALMPPEAGTRILASGTELAFTAGEHIDGQPQVRGEGSVPEHCDLVVVGLVRVYAHHQTRQVTRRYIGPGFALGVPALFHGTGDVLSQAVTDTRVLRVRGDVIRDLAAIDPQVGLVLCHTLASIVFENGELLSDNIFRPMRERVARHLLDLADRDDAGRITVRANPQDIADAIGTVREVVTRVLKPMREDGLVIREGRTYVLPDPGALHVVAHGDRLTDG